jgi:hypothetical protein
MTGKKKTLLIILASTFFALIAGFTISSYWLKNVYLREKIDANVDANNLQKWYLADSFSAPDDSHISQQQVESFIAVNKELIYLLEDLRLKFEANSWSIAVEMIKMQPEWLANKYLALKKYNLSPIEYDWIAKRVVQFWIYRWKLQSLEILQEYGWEIDKTEESSTDAPFDYELFLRYEQELNLIFDILWPERDGKNVSVTDTDNR